MKQKIVSEYVENLVAALGYEVTAYAYNLIEKNMSELYERAYIIGNGRGRTEMQREESLNYNNFI